MLSAENFLSVVNMTQIVSIDLIVKNDNGKILLGKRRNAPAKGFYFVPGGRLFKNETIKEGSRRIVLWELGLENLKPKPRCVSEHIYSDNFADAKDMDNKTISTHYVCFAFDLDIDTYDDETFKQQHSEAIWLTPGEILEREDVHEYIKLYFTPDAYNRFEN